MTSKNLHTIYRILSQPGNSKEFRIVCQVAVGLQKKLKEIYPEALVMVRLPDSDTSGEAVGFHIKGEGLSGEDIQSIIKELQEIEEDYISSRDWENRDPAECWQYLRTFLDRQDNSSPVEY